jgi:hypothetical protein
MTKLIDNNYSKRELASAFQIELPTLELILNIIKDQGIKLDQFKSVQYLRKQCFNPPDRINEQLEAINELTDGCGVESITFEGYHYNSYWGNCIGLYVNFGDTYQLTTIYDVSNNQFEFISWGDFYESKEQEIRLDSTDY